MCFTVPTSWSKIGGFIYFPTCPQIENSELYKSGYRPIDDHSCSNEFIFARGLALEFPILIACKFTTHVLILTVFF